jgi:hypothetical protein
MLKLVEVEERWGGGCFVFCVVLWLCCDCVVWCVVIMLIVLWLCIICYKLYIILYNDWEVREGERREDSEMWDSKISLTSHNSPLLHSLNSSELGPLPVWGSWDLDGIQRFSHISSRPWFEREISSTREVSPSQNLKKGLVSTTEVLKSIFSTSASIPIDSPPSITYRGNRLGGDPNKSGVLIEILTFLQGHILAA